MGKCSYNRGSLRNYTNHWANARITKGYVRNYMCTRRMPNRIALCTEIYYLTMGIYWRNYSYHLISLLIFTALGAQYKGLLENITVDPNM